VANETIVEVRNLTTHYGEALVLDGVSMEVRRGEIVVILGGSGCGKSTLLKHMIGLLRPTSGEILLWGQDIARMDEDQLRPMLTRVGISFQSGGLFNSMTVGENVALPIKEKNPDIDRETLDMLVRIKLGLVGLSAAVNKTPGELSGGMKKRAGVARALALDPEILFLDEPSAGLDPIMAAGLDQLILNLRHLLGITVVVVTHELDSIKEIADTAVMLDKGRVIFNGRLDEALESDHPRVSQFFQRKPDAHIAPRNA